MRRLDALAALAALVAVVFLACSDDPLDGAIPQSGGTPPEPVVKSDAHNLHSAASGTSAVSTTAAVSNRDTAVVPATEAPPVSADLPEPTTTTVPPTTAAPDTIRSTATASVPAWAQGVPGAERVPAILWAIAACEGAIHPGVHDPWTEQNHSGPNGEAESTASGPWQALDGTWNGYGGYSRAMYAPPAMQVEFAIGLYERLGTRPWNASAHCWRNR